MAGDWLREWVERELVVERDGWAAERVASIRRRLMPASAGYDVLVIWVDQHNAATGPGHTIYLSRRLMELLDEDATAFVIAHEIAHHLLGHIPSMADLSRWLVRVQGHLGLWLLDSMISTRDNELDADAMAIELCLDAGYDPDRCLSAFEHLASVQLDHGDLEGALGRERGGLPRGEHPTTDTRIAAVRERIAAHQRGTRVRSDISRDRQRRRRRRILAIAASVAATVIAIVVWRRPR